MYEPVIGLEVHVQLKTKTKIFCGCPTQFGQQQNQSVCPVCLGLPGTLPVLNKKAVELAIKTGHALQCSIAERFKFDRKNYFYPDLPKAYQISQFDKPICVGGTIRICMDGKEKDIGITRAHLEEDAGKLMHDEAGHSKDSCVDYNRTGTPLLEIVSEPDIRSPEEAYAYLVSLKSILEYLEVSDCNMQEGSLRCDANVSIRPIGTIPFGTKTEIKNMNSFKGVQKAIHYEIERQKKMLDAGHSIVQETRLWNADQGKTYSMRSKEEAHDYRYFPEPDLPYIQLKQSMIDDIKASLPELPQDRQKRFINDYKLPDYDAGVLIADKEIANYFEKCVSLYPKAKSISNWIMVDLMKLMNEDHIALDRIQITPEKLTDLLKIIDSGTISLRAGKEIFPEIFRTGKDAKDIVQEKGLVQLSDSAALEVIVDDIIATHPKSVTDYQNGQKKAISFLMGQIMKKTQGKANPKIVNTLIQQKLDEKRS